MKTSHGSMHSALLNGADELAIMKALFLKYVRQEHIRVEWDSGQCYPYIEHPIMSEAERVLSWKDSDRFLCFAEDWVSENEPELFDLVGVVDGKLVGAVETLEGDEAKEYARGLINLIQTRADSYMLQSREYEEMLAFLNLP